MRKQENRSQNVLTLWMCSLNCRQSRSEQQASAVDKALFPCWNQLSGNQMYCMVRWCWFSFVWAKLFVINFCNILQRCFCIYQIITMLREAPCKALCNSLALSHLRPSFGFVVSAVFQKHKNNSVSCCDFAVHCSWKKKPKHWPPETPNQLWPGLLGRAIRQGG